MDERGERGWISLGAQAGTAPSSLEVGIDAGALTDSDRDRVAVLDVYVTDGGTGVDVYHIYTGALVGTITAGATLKDMIVSGDGGTLYVIDGADDKIVPVDLETLTAGAPWQAESFAAVYASLEYLRLFDRDVLITSRSEVFDAATGEQITKIETNIIGQEYATAAAGDGSQSESPTLVSAAR